jgi:hypothetical protein
LLTGEAMTTVRKISYPNICLFDDEYLTNSNPLKDFIYYLKSHGTLGVIDFSYSDKIDSLHPKLTIKENLILDAIPKSFIRDNLNNFDEIINALDNKHLKQMIKQMNNLDIPVGLVSSENIKLASLVKSLLSEHEYLFLVNPEEFQNINTIQTIKDCISYEVENNSKTVLIKSVKKELWFDIATHFIAKNQDHTFTKTKNPLYKVSKITSGYTPTYDFTLIKKVS